MRMVQLALDKEFYQKALLKWAGVALKFLDTQKYGILVLVSAWCAADLALISLRPLFLSSASLPVYSSALNSPKKKRGVDEYMPIWDFNIFHNGDIPPSLSKEQAKQIINKIPQLSRLPLQLNGIVIYRDPSYSIASITIKGKDKSGAYRTGDKVENMASITRIEHQRVYFINLVANAEEYIELPRSEGGVLNKTPIVPKSRPSGLASAMIKKVGPFQYQVSRSDVNKHVRSLPNILMDAKVVPHWENGKMAGWRFEYVKKGSIYDQFDFKKSDIITSVAGELPATKIQAAELFQKMKNQSKISATVRKNGREVPFSWFIQEDVSIEEPPRSRFY